MVEEKFHNSQRLHLSLRQRGSHKLLRTAALLVAVVGLISCTESPNRTLEHKMSNKNVVENFFVALERQNFGQMKFPREIYATEDPNFFFVKFKGDIEIKAGGKYENDYMATFKLENGKVVEYTEYFNPIIMAKAFGIALK
jgi:Phenazine biosynthesis protein A/B